MAKKYGRWKRLVGGKVQLIGTQYPMTVQVEPIGTGWRPAVFTGERRITGGTYQQQADAKQAAIGLAEDFGIL